MKMTLACAAAVLTLTLTARGPKQETVAVPGVGTVTTTEQNGTSTVGVQGPGGQTSTSTVVDSKEGAGQAVTVTGSQAGGTFRASNTAEEGDFTVPFYPGSELASGGRHEATDGAGRSTRTAAAQLTTKDSVDRVVAFYSSRVQGGNRVDTTIDGRRTVVLAPEDPARGTSITVTQEEDGTTRITLVSQGG